MFIPIQEVINSYFNEHIVSKNTRIFFKFLVLVIKIYRCQTSENYLGVFNYFQVYPQIMGNKASMKLSK